MAKPAIYIVAPDPNFVKVAERHLNTEFGDRFCILSVDSGDLALGELKQLKQHQPLALFMVEQQMPDTGIEFCQQA